MGYGASRGTRAGLARALQDGRRMSSTVRRGEASRRRLASVRLRVSRLRPAYAPAVGVPVGGCLSPLPPVTASEGKACGLECFLGERFVDFAGQAAYAYGAHRC